MSAENKAQNVTIKEIKEQNKFFEIPYYQRLYEWGENEINELLNDMKKACDDKDKKEYFIGTITTSKKDGKFVLIDGQQRLTTLWFVGFYLASQNYGEWQKFITDNNNNLRIAMPIRDNEEKALKELAHNINGKQNLAQFLEGCNVAPKIIGAFECIKSWFDRNFDKNKDSMGLSIFADFIFTNVCFVLVELAKNTDLNRFFVRMNNRGKQLEKHEILKARMLNAIRESDKDNKDKKDEWQKYAKIWDLCSDMNKYIFQSANDRKDLNSEDENGDKQTIDSIINSQSNFNNKKTANNDDAPSKVESIIDFSTFLLHCYKLFTKSDIAIVKDKLLDIMWEKEQNQILKDSGEKCKEFIVAMLRYRVLFDYFVIKNNTDIKQGNAFKIRRLQEYKSKDKTYYRLPEESAIDNSSLKNLAMIQNYLRVARQGERQNYEHWLTDFLEFLNTDKDLQNFSDIKEVKNFVDNFLNNTNNKELQLPQSLIVSKDKENKTDKALQDKLVVELEKIDTQQICKVNLKDKELDEISIDFLANYLPNGTHTPHYWFYRLEYYLWKWGQKDNRISGEIRAIFVQFDGLEFPKGDKFKFEKILNAFYFRNLNSVEHIEPQSNFRKEFGWTEQNIERFGNLALISPFFNSQLSNQSSRHKALDLRKKIDDGNAESLKLWLVYAMYIKESDKWTYKDAKEHQNQMLEILVQSLK